MAERGMGDGTAWHGAWRSRRQDKEGQDRVLSFDTDGVRFNLRVAGVILAGDHVLLTQIAGADYWFLPGGRVEPGEPTDAALRRELWEELDVHAHVGRLLWVVESFFTLEGRRFHEVGFYYRVTLPGVAASGGAAGGRVPSRGATSRKQDGANVLLFQWFPLGDLGAGVRLLPSFLAEALAHLPKTTRHVVYREEPAG